MNNNARDKKYELLTYQAFERRIPPNHPIKPNVLKDLKIKYAEVYGENEIKYRLRFIDKQKFIVLHNLRLQDEDGHFQIDSLILSTYFLMDIDAKNWNGIVRFGANGQVTRIDQDGTKEGFQNPVDQVKTQVFRLIRWLKKHNYPHIPIDYLVVISFPKTIIERETPQDIIPPEVIHSSDLIFQIHESERKYTKSLITGPQLLQLSKFLERSHCPVDLNLFNKYEVNPNELLKGVFCPSCGAQPMIRHKRKWYCLNCKHTSTTAHKQALMDYSLLFGEWITNKQARTFLSISSPEVAKWILKKESHYSIGQTKGKKYKLKIQV